MSPSSRPVRHQREEVFPDWASLPIDLLVLVAEKLGSALNYLRFRSVCHNWRSAPTPTALNFSPLLLLPFNPDTNILPIFDLSDGKVYSLPLPEARHKVFLGSSCGWLVLIDESGDISLLNPFIRTQLCLPPVTRMLALASLVPAEKEDRRGWVVQKPYETCPVTLHGMRKTFISEVTLSCSPRSGNDCLVLAILAKSNKIAFCRPGDAEWKLLDTDLPGCVSSIAYCDGRIFAVDACGQVAICCIEPTVVATRAQGVQPPHHVDSYRILVVGKELLILAGHLKGPRASKLYTRHYEMYRSGFDGVLEWSRALHIDDMTLFVSWQFKLNTISGRFPSYKKNSVYFYEVLTGINYKTAYNWFGDHCIQVYAHDSFETVPCHWAVQSPREVSWFMPHLSEQG